MIDVLVDMTALNTPSRERGVGRYVHSLCAELSRRQEWLPHYPNLPGRDLSLTGLIRHQGSVDGALDPTLTFSGDYGIRTSNLQYQRHKLERRLFMGSLLNRVTIGIGAFFDFRVVLFLTTEDLAFFKLDLFLTLDDFDLHLLLRDFLLRTCVFEIIRLVGFRLRDILFAAVVCHLQLIFFFRFSDLGRTFKFCFFRIF